MHIRIEKRKTHNVITLECENRFTVVFSSVGASIQKILIPLPDGGLQNIALSFEEENAYWDNPLYAGATLAPAAGRISRGRLPVLSEVFSLSKNENNLHTLHGGFHNASFQNWELDEYSEKGNLARLVFSLAMPDLLDGFPGNRTLKTIYTLTDELLLTIEYEAVSDRDTYFNLSNHTYFNLSGSFDRPADDHLLQINADRYLCNAPDFIPEALASVERTPFDFRNPKTLRQQKADYPDDIQLKRNCGYNHGFLLEHSDSAPQGSCDLTCSLSGAPIRLTASSDAPCLVLYSGGYIPDDLSLSKGQRSVPGCALAFEFQDYPDAPGGHGLPYRPAAAGEVWRRRICFHFYIR